MATFAYVRGFVSSRQLVQVLGACLAVSLTCFPAFSQANTGRMQGTVSDQTGAAVVGAKVTITDVERRTPRVLITDQAGAYNAPSLLPGTYTLRVEFAGFQAVERPNIVLEVGRELQLDFALQPGQQTQTVTVTAETPLVDTSTATLGGTLQPGTIQDLPLNGRNFMNLLSLRPGVFYAPGGGAWWQTTNGLRPEHNVYILDGITAMEPFGGQSTINSVSLAGDSATLLPLDTIQEFATQQNPKAEYGWKPGTIATIALKSGTNAYNGTANAFGRTDAMDATNPFLSGGLKQEIALENYGGTFGGPIKKDKLFFFAAYEGQRYTVGNPTFLTFPSLDPNAANLGANTASVIKACLNTPAASRSGTSLKMSGLDANCNRTSGYSIFDLQGSTWSRDAGGANVSGALDTEYGLDGGLGKIDYNINDKNTINAKYFYGQHNGLVVNNQTITQPYWRPTDSAKVDFAGGQWNYIATSALLNTVRVAFNYFYQQFETSDCPGSTAPDYGINFGYGTAKPNCGFTNIVLTPFTGTIGCCSSFPKYYGPDHIWEFVDNLSYTRGRHSFKTGFELRTSSIGQGGAFNRGRGQTTFATLEGFISGTPSANGQILVGDPRRNVSQKAYAAFFQDDWRISPRFILNLGLRYEYLTPLQEGKNLLANFDPSRGFFQLGTGGVDQLWAPDKNNFAPRIGFAWNVFGDGKTVIRGGSNIIYVTPVWWAFLSQQNTNNPTTGLNTNPSGFTLCRGAINATGVGCAPGVTDDPTIGTIAAAGVPLTPAQTNWSQTSALYGGNIYPSSSDTSLLKCGTNRICSVQATDPNLRNSYVFSWSLGIQRQLTNTISLDLNYVGNHGTKLLGLNYTNTPPYGAGYCLGFTAAQRAAVGNCPTTITSSTATNAAAIQLARPLNALYPYLSYIYTVQNLNLSNYNGLQATVTQRVTHGLNYTLGYSFAHAIDNGGSDRAGPTGTPFDFKRDYGSGDFDVRHRFTGTITYALPSKKGFGQLLEGWKLTSIVTVQSALPWGTAGSRGNDPAGIAEFQDRWNFYGDAADFSGLGRNSVPYFAPSAAVNNPTCTAKAGPPGSLGYAALQKWGCFVNGNSVMVPPAFGTIGNMGRNIFRGNPFSNWDASIMKDFKFTERFTAQFRIESFNILNHTRYANPTLNGAGGNLPFGTPTQFGQSQSTPDVGNNNPSLGSGGPREFQLGLKLTF